MRALALSIAVPAYAGVPLTYRGLSTSEAAHVLGIPDGTVKSRAHYALRALRLALQEMGVTA